MSEKRKLYLHIGAHKTASTFLYANLRVHNDKLAQCGLGIVFRREILNSPFAQELRAVAEGQHGADDIGPELRKSIEALVSRHDGNVLIANEDLICSLEIQDFYQNIDQSMRYIRNSLGEFDIHFVLYVRKQPDFIESTYTQMIQAGRPVKLPPFLARAFATDMSWLRVLQGVEKAMPHDRIIVRPFEIIRTLGDDGFFHDFLRTCGIEDPARFRIAEETRVGRAANRSYSAIAMRIAQSANAHLTKPEKKLLRRFLQEHFSTVTHPRAALLTVEQRQTIFDRYADSNRALFDRYDLNGPGDALGYF